jgi:hypothetical protein
MGQTYDIPMTWPTILIGEVTMFDSKKNRDDIRLRPPF